MAYTISAISRLPHNHCYYNYLVEI